MNAWRPNEATWVVILAVAAALIALGVAATCMGSFVKMLNQATMPPTPRRRGRMTHPLRRSEVYGILGEQTLGTIVDVFHDNVMSDPEVEPYFREALTRRRSNLRKHTVDAFAFLLGDSTRVLDVPQLVNIHAKVRHAETGAPIGKWITVRVGNHLLNACRAVGAINDVMEIMTALWLEKAPQIVPGAFAVAQPEPVS